MSPSVRVRIERPSFTEPTMKMSTPAVILDGVYSVASAGVRVVSLFKGRNVKHVAGTSPKLTKGQRTLSGALAGIFSFGAAVSTASVIKRHQDPSMAPATEYTVARASDTELELMSHARLAIVIQATRQLVRGRTDAGNYPLSRIGYAANGLTAVRAAYGLYENASELYRRADTRKLKRALGI